MENQEVDISIVENLISDRKAIFSSVRKYRRNNRTTSLRELQKHQGKTNDCIIAAKASLHFFTPMWHKPNLNIGDSSSIVLDGTREIERLPP